MGYLLGIDIGTSGTKALLCDERGEVQATATQGHAAPTGDGPGWSEQDPADWWRAAVAAVRQVMTRTGIAGEEVTGIGLSGQMHGLVCLDDAGPEDAEALRQAILWNDQRTTEECEDLEKAAGSRRNLIEMTGNPALTGFTAPKILWVRRHEPAVYDKARHLLLPKDFIRYRMTGEYATDVGDASGTSLLDVRKRKWHRTLIGQLGIDVALLPRCYESHEVTGSLRETAAEVMGLKAGTPVVAGSGDQPAGAVGNGIVRPGIVSATIGTSGVVFAHARKASYDPRGRVHTMCSAVAGEYCVFGCMLAAGGSLEWYRHALGEDAAGEAERRGMNVYDLLASWASQSEPGAGGLFFLPYLTGERCPHADPYARGAWIGLTTRTTRSDMLRALLEGVTFGMADALRVIDKMGVAISTVRLSGGGARNAFWRQMQTDIYARPTATIHSEEGPALGAALLAGVGTGTWASVVEACDVAVREVEHRTPDQATARRYAKLHPQYRRLYPALKEQFARLADLG